MLAMRLWNNAAVNCWNASSCLGSEWKSCWRTWWAGWLDKKCYGSSMVIPSSKTGKETFTIIAYDCLEIRIKKHGLNGFKWLILGSTSAMPSTPWQITTNDWLPCPCSRRSCELDPGENLTLPNMLCRSMRYAQISHESSLYWDFFGDFCCLKLKSWTCPGFVWNKSLKTWPQRASWTWGETVRKPYGQSGMSSQAVLSQKPVTKQYYPLWVIAMDLSFLNKLALCVSISRHNGSGFAKLQMKGINVMKQQPLGFPPTKTQNTVLC